jgi:DNA-binding transcriptional ArsR family regulator
VDTAGGAAALGREFAPSPVLRAAPARPAAPSPRPTVPSTRLDILNHLVKSQSPPEELDLVFSALADPTRRAIVVRLSAGEASVSELARPFDVSLPAITKHLAVLERAGLLEHEKEGRVRHCRLVAAPMKTADDWLSSYRRFWDDRLDSLTDHLKSIQEAQ